MKTIKKWFNRKINYIDENIENYQYNDKQKAALIFVDFILRFMIIIPFVALILYLLIFGVLNTNYLSFFGGVIIFLIMIIFAIPVLRGIEYLFKINK